MSGKQYQGTATIRVNGQEYETLEGATFSPSGFEREVVKGAKVYGYRQKPREATLDCKFPAGGEGFVEGDTVRFEIKVRSRLSSWPIPVKST